MCLYLIKRESSMQGKLIISQTINVFVIHIELFPALNEHKYTIVRKYTQVINDHIHFGKKIQIFLQFCSFARDVTSKTRANSAKLSAF